MGTLNEASAHRRTADPIIQARKRDSASKAVHQGTSGSLGAAFSPTMVSSPSETSSRTRTKPNKDLTSSSLKAEYASQTGLTFPSLRPFWSFSGKRRVKMKNIYEGKAALKAELLLCSVMRSGLLVYRDNVFREMGLKFGGRYGSLNQFDEGDSH